MQSMCVYHFEMSHFDTFDFETPQFENSHFEICKDCVETLYERAIPMDQKISIDFIRQQLEAIKNSQSSEFSAGIAASMINYIDTYSMPDIVSLSYIPETVPNKISAIKELRALINCGLREAKDHVEMGTVFLKTPNVSDAVRAYKHMKQFGKIKVNGGAAFETLFGS